MADKWGIASKESWCPKCHTKIPLGAEIWKKSAGVTYCSLCGHDAEDNPRVKGPQELAIEDFLSAMPPAASVHPLAACILKLAQQIDDGDVPPREMTNYTKEIRIGVFGLRDEFPVSDEDDPTDQARKARDRRAREQHGI
ncbi:hypothetical protein [Bradyrhizobium sp.]